MEFRNEIREMEVLDVEIGVIVGNPFEMVNRPFASNIIRDDDVWDGEAPQHRRNDIIHIDVPAQQSTFTVFHRVQSTAHTVHLAADQQPHSFA